MEQYVSKKQLKVHVIVVKCDEGERSNLNQEQNKMKQKREL